MKLFIHPQTSTAQPLKDWKCESKASYGVNFVSNDHVVYFLLLSILSMQCCMLYHVILDRVLTAPSRKYGSIITINVITIIPTTNIICVTDFVNANDVCGVVVTQWLWWWWWWWWWLWWHHVYLVCGLALQWRHMSVTGVSIYRQLDWSFNSLLRLTSKKTQKLLITGALWRKSTGDRWIPLTKGQ